MAGKVSVEEISKHSTADDAWIVINGTVWDVTKFMPEHPGGVQVIAEYLGQDASKAYNEVHGPSLAAKHLPSETNKGSLDESSITDEWRSKQAQNVEDTSPAKSQDSKAEKPPLESIINLYDFESVANQFFTPKTWAFQAGAANDNLTLHHNAEFYRRIFFRPRVLVGVKDVNTSCTVLGHKFSLPIFTSPAALAKLSHPEGELAMARAAVSVGSTIIACNNASYSLSEIRAVVPKDYPVFYQLYFNKDRQMTEKLLRDDVLPYSPAAIMVTVDLPVVGKREADERIKIDATYQTEKHAQQREIKADKKGSGLARATGSFIDADLKWADILWLRKFTEDKVPVFVKGIQCAADARMALNVGCRGIYISNHGGRAVDTAQPSLLTLLEIQANCPEVLEQMEVFIDGGVRRGTDVLKAICLGASGVCLGRSFLWAVGYGEEGVVHAYELLKDELETAMQHVGIKRLEQAHPGLLNTGDVDGFVYRGDGHPWARQIVRNRGVRPKL